MTEVTGDPGAGAGGRPGGGGALCGVHRHFCEIPKDGAGFLRKTVKAASFLQRKAGAADSGAFFLAISSILSLTEGSGGGRCICPVAQLRRPAESLGALMLGFPHGSSARATGRDRQQADAAAETSRHGCMGTCAASWVLLGGRPTVAILCGPTRMCAQKGCVATGTHSHGVQLRFLPQCTPRSMSEHSGQGSYVSRHTQTNTPHHPQGQQRVPLYPRKLHFPGSLAPGFWAVLANRRL